AHVRQGLAGRPASKVVTKAGAMQERIEDIVEESVRSVREIRDTGPPRDAVVAAACIVVQLRRINARWRDLRQPAESVVVHGGDGGAAGKGDGPSVIRVARLQCLEPGRIDIVSGFRIPGRRL